MLNFCWELVWGQGGGLARVGYSEAGPGYEEQGSFTRGHQTLGLIAQPSVTGHMHIGLRLRGRSLD